MSGFTLHPDLGASSSGVTIRSWGDDDLRYGPPRVNWLPGKQQRYVHVELNADAYTDVCLAPTGPLGGAVDTRTKTLSWGERGSGPTPLLTFAPGLITASFPPECWGHWLVNVRDAGVLPLLGIVSFPIFVRALGT